MAIRLRNEKDMSKALYLATSAWQGILELAMDYGWNPMGTRAGDLDISLVWRPVISVDAYFPAIEYMQRSRESNGWDRLVLLDDALNLADALQEAFLRVEPVRVPATYFLFEPEDESPRSRPGIGTLLAVMDLAYLGAFRVEYRRWPPGRRLP